MAIAVVMPRQGQSVESCIITKWHKSKGESVKTGDLLFSYETDKAAFDEEAKEDGVLLEIFFSEGDEVPVLENVAVIGQSGDGYEELIPSGFAGNDNKSAETKISDGKGITSERETVTDREATPGTEPVPEREVTPGTRADREPPAAPGEETKVLAGDGRTGVPPDDSKTVGQTDDSKTRGQSGEGRTGDQSGDGSRDVAGEKGRLRASPLARKLAREHNLTLEKIQGTGPQGRIIERDIKDAAASLREGVDYTESRERQVLQSTDPPEYKTGMPAGPAKRPEGEGDFTDIKLSNMRRIIAGKMEQSLQNSAQLTHHMSADARKMLAWRKEIKAEKDKPGVADIGINDMVCYAVIRALKKHSFMNAHFTGTALRQFSKVHLGIAVDTERGLMVPVVRNADDLNAGGLAEKIKTLAGECRKGSVDPGLLASEAASFTITNLGAYGVEMFTPVLNLPQVGILGVNTITYRPADLGDGAIGFIPVIGLSLTYDHRAVDGAPASLFLAEVKKEIENIESH